MSNFEEQRYERLKETVSEYLDEGDGTAAQFVQDLQRTLLENCKYFSERVEQYNELLKFYQGGAQQ